MAPEALRVVMPALTFVPGHMGGSETYARNLVAELDARSDVDLTVVVSRAGAGSLPARNELVVDRTRGGDGTRDRLLTLARGARATPAVREVLAAADVVHHPFTVPIPLGTRPRVQTLLDVQHLDLPELFSRTERVYRRAAYDRTAQRADRVITISEFCRERITARLGISPERIDVAYLGVDRTFFTPGVAAEQQPFVFYPAAAWPHKNHARLIAAMEIVRRDQPDLRLVLTGDRAGALGALPEWVDHRGRVSDEEVRDLYRSAACLVFPSMYEGFGLPPLEAMASGCPVAAASSGSLPEVCGDAAVFFDPEDVGAIADGVIDAVGVRDRLVAAGLAQATRFSWEACAQAHVDSYRAAAIR